MGVYSIKKKILSHFEQNKFETLHPVYVVISFDGHLQETFLYKKNQIVWSTELQREKIGCRDAPHLKNDTKYITWNNLETTNSDFVYFVSTKVK